MNNLHLFIIPVPFHSPIFYFIFLQNSFRCCVIVVYIALDGHISHCQHLTPKPDHTQQHNNMTRRSFCLLYRIGTIIQLLDVSIKWSWQGKHRAGSDNHNLTIISIRKNIKYQERKITFKAHNHEVRVIELQQIISLLPN